MMPNHPCCPYAWGAESEELQGEPSPCSPPRVTGVLSLGKSQGKVFRGFGERGCVPGWLPHAVWGQTGRAVAAVLVQPRLSGTQQAFAPLSVFSGINFFVSLEDCKLSSLL